MAALCSALLRSLGRPAGTLSVVFAGAREMRSLNRRYLGRDYATDVLSFDYAGVMMEGWTFLGEIIVSPEAAARQAVRYGTSPERELRRLLVHGILHVSGYDHESDRGRMKRAQNRLMRLKCVAESPVLVDWKSSYRGLRPSRPA